MSTGLAYLARADEMPADERRTRLDLLEDLRHVFPDETDREDAKGAEEHDEQHHRRDAARRQPGKEQPPEQLQRAEHHGEKHESDAAKGEHIERRAAEGEDTLLRPADVLEETV